MLKLKAEFTNKIVERRSPISRTTIKVDFKTYPESKYPKLLNCGFIDCFEAVSNKEPLNVIQVTVDGYHDLTYAELKEQAKKRGIEFAGNIKKAELIALLDAK